MCVPGVHMCVCVLYKKHTLVFHVHGCTSARAACTVSVVYMICVFHMCTHVCV